MRIRRWAVPLIVGGFLLLSCSGNSTSKLIARLGDGDPKVRRAAARTLGDEHEKASDVVVTALTAARKDGDLDVRELAIAALGHLGTAAKLSAPALEQALADPELSVRLCAALALQKIEPVSQSYVPVILEALNAGHGTVFLEVGRMGTDAKWAVPTLIKLLSHQQAGIRALAARTLGQIGVAASDAESPLKQSLRDGDPAVRRAAKKALQQIQVHGG
jgi:hypothetical protein